MTYCVAAMTDAGIVFASDSRTNAGVDQLAIFSKMTIIEAPDDRVVVLEIEVDGAQQVKKAHPDAVLIFVLPPSREEQERRLRGRGDPESKVLERLQKALDEEPVGLAIADHVVINDDLERSVAEMAAIIEQHRASRL